MAERRDYVERLVQQLVQAVAAIGGLRAARQFDAALEAVRAAESDLLGPFLDVLDRFEASSAIAIAGVEPARAYAALVAEEALIHAQAGDEASASLCARRAMEIYAALRAGGTVLGREDEARAAVLSRRFGG